MTTEPTTRLRPESRSVRVVQARMVIAEHGRSVRLAAGLTLADIARDLGVGISSVSLWERGRHSPPPDVALAWLAILEDLARAVQASAA